MLDDYLLCNKEIWFYLVWVGLAWLGFIWFDLILFDSIRSDLFLLDSILSDLIRSVPIRFDFNWFELSWFDHAYCEMTGHIRCGTILIQYVAFDDLFTFSPNRSTRGHVYKLYCSKCNLNVRSHFFPQHCITAWNSLSNDVVTSPSLSIFNSRPRLYICTMSILRSF